MWWTADKVAYRNRDDFVRAYQGSELIWEKNRNKIFYTSSDGQVVIPYNNNFGGLNIVSNIYSDGVGVIEFDGPLTEIGEYAFNIRNNLTSINIPSSVTSFGKGVFYGCGNLTSITLPPYITSIPPYMLASCGLTSIDIPFGVTSIGVDAFGVCRNLRTVNIPSSVTSIGGIAFQYCERLTSVNIPSSVTSIGSNVFRFCTRMTSIHIPSSVTSIGDGVSEYTDIAQGCTSLTSITVDSNNSYYDSRNNCNGIIETATNTIIQGCKNTVIPSSVVVIGNYSFDEVGISSITIPSGVTSIGKLAFKYGRFTSITIPSGVTSIGSFGFDSCSRLVEVIVNSVIPPDIGEFCFRSSAQGRLIKVPASSLQDYLNAPGWSYYASSIVAQ